MRRRRSSKPQNCPSTWPLGRTSNPVNAGGAAERQWRLRPPPRTSRRRPQRPSRRRRRVIAASEAAADPAVEQNEELAEAEADLTRRYPDRRIKPGSLRHAGAVPGFGTKRTVVIVCDCGADRTLATSDLFHVRQCAGCARQAKKRRTRNVK